MSQGNEHSLLKILSQRAPRCAARRDVPQGADEHQVGAVLCSAGGPAAACMALCVLQSKEDGTEELWEQLTHHY